MARHGVTRTKSGAAEDGPGSTSIAIEREEEEQESDGEKESPGPGTVCCVRVSNVVSNPF
jgi:hypothetical protein